MGLFNKLKNVLFEEEDIEEEVNDNVEELPKQEAIYEEVSEYKPIMPEHKDLPKVKEPVFEKVKQEENDYSERELFKSEPTFKFPSFDEEEFNTSMPDKKEEEEKRFSNTMDFERRKREERRSDYSRLDIVKPKEDVKEEKKRFKPSPVISPVYGILDKDYKADDIVEATPNGGTILTNKDLDVDSVRAKAFGKLKNITDEKKKEKPVIVSETYEIKKEVKKEEPVKEEVKKVDKKDDKIEEMLDDVVITSEPIIEDSSKLMEERTKTIDELLKDASDQVIDVTDDITESLDLTEEYRKLENEIDDALDLTSHIEPLVDDEEDEKETKSSKKKEKSSALENDTLENDLYDLIDSMYDNTEDGE